ncbi:MAG: orotidine-5'-phosphate decarboxylase [Desulfobacteraceae bacterium]|nr:orotidine-5'-phosphate decarboxylase [Desulfobacteraceae bacterium]
MRSAKSYIVFPLDVPTESLARQWVMKLRDHVGMFKVGLELFIRSGPDMIKWIADNCPAGIFLDLKLHDIPATVKRAMHGVVDLGVDLVTVHCGESRAMLEAAVQASQGKVRVLGVTVLTSVSKTDLLAPGNFYNPDVEIQRLVLHKAEMAKNAGCSGIVCSGFESKTIKQNFGSDFLAVTPGIRPEGNTAEKDDQRRVLTPSMAIGNGSDYLVIGRPIRDAADPVETVRRIAAQIESALLVRPDGCSAKARQ